MDGILLVNKPSGLSSYDVIRRIKSVFSGAGLPAPKLGHAGTLDPLAEGLLIILLGKTCKSQNNFMKLDKEYTAQITLGASSTTDDAEGMISKTQKAINNKPSLGQLQQVLKNFEGEIMQVPPQFSAIKVAGERSYRLARHGDAVELKPRPVSIYEIEILTYRYPYLEIRTRVSSGTYIRSLARDVGEALGTAGYLSRLVRNRIGQFELNLSLELKDLTLELMQSHLVLPGDES